MPPTETPQTNEKTTSHKTSVGPTAGIVIIVLLLIIGAFYFWGEEINRRHSSTIPYIPGDATTTDEQI